MSTKIISTKPAYLDLLGTCSFVALSESTIQKLVREKTFPLPRVLSGRRTGYLVRELEAWAEARPISELLPPENTGAKKPRATAAAPPAGQPAA